MIKYILLSVSFLVSDVTDAQIQHSTVRIVHVSQTKENNETIILSYYGSGTVIKQNDSFFDVLTCEHILKGNTLLYVNIWDETKYECKILNKDKDLDLALLRINFKANVRPVQIATEEDYSIKTNLCKAGYPNGGKYSFRKGSSLGMFRKSNGSEFLSFLGSIPAISGDSGGGIHRLPDGHLIGVVWGAKDETFRARMIPEIHQFLKESNWK